MGKLIRNDVELANRLKLFFEKVADHCDLVVPEELYLAEAARALSLEAESFFASLEVDYYGKLKNACVNTLPTVVEPDTILNRVIKDVDAQRVALSIKPGLAARFDTSEAIKAVLNPLWPVSEYDTFDDAYNNVAIGKRHPRKLAREALKRAALLDTNRLYDKAIHAFECYFSLDTSQLEVYKNFKKWCTRCIEGPIIIESAGYSFKKAEKHFDFFASNQANLEYYLKENLVTSELSMRVLFAT